MDKNYEQEYLSLEDHHPWFVARRECIRYFLNHTSQSARILDVGCSGGALLHMLRALGFTKCTGIDMSEVARARCEERGITAVYHMDGAQPDFPENSFDVIIASDVLEHILDDEYALKQWHRILSRGGTLICFVPAFPCLWSSFDELNHHFRRYKKNELVLKCTNAGFRVRKSGFWNCILFLPVFIGHLCSFSNNRLSSMPPFIAPCINLLLWIESAIIRFLPLPFGLSVFVVAEKE